MDDIHLGLLFGILGLLVIASGFFSSSETGMMSLNRYRLKHLVNKKHRGATSASKLLERPDRLIGVILIGNNLVNNFAAALATLLAIRLYGEGAVFPASIVLTLVVLIFAEVTPKTVAALYPEKVAFPASFVLRPLLFILYPFVWSVNGISNGLARLLGVDPNEANSSEHLAPEELRTVVDEHGDLIPDQHQGMLLNVLDLEKATVEDIMIPRNEVIGLDLEDDMPSLLKKIRTSNCTRLPVYEGDINNIVGILHLRNAARFIYGGDDTVTKEAIRRFTRDPYFVPEGTPLHTQLMQFQTQKRRMAIVVDEYGDVQGIVTMEDLLEEIVGEFTTNFHGNDSDEINELADGWFDIEGGASIRDINRQLGWTLPTDGPKTLNGLMVEYMENIPAGQVGFHIERYRFETTELTDKMIARAKVKNLGI